jgi:hypothetical protein
VILKRRETWEFSTIISPAYSLLAFAHLEQREATFRSNQFPWISSEPRFPNISGVHKAENQRVLSHTASWASSKNAPHFPGTLANTCMWGKCPSLRTVVAKGWREVCMELAQTRRSLWTSCGEESCDSTHGIEYQKEFYVLTKETDNKWYSDLA